MANPHIDVTTNATVRTPADLAEQVRQLRKACEEARLFIEAHEEGDTFLVGDHVRHALAATAPTPPEARP